MTNCPTCGQPVAAKPLSDTADAVLRAMKVGNYDVYRTRDGYWCVTYTKGLHFSDKPVGELIARGLIQQTYPDCQDCFSLPGRAGLVHQRAGFLRARRAAKASRLTPPQPPC